MDDRIVTLEQDTQACVTDTMFESGGEGGGRELRNRTGVQLQTRREPHKMSELDLRFKPNEVLSIHSLPTELLPVIHHLMRPYFKHSQFNYYEFLISLTGVCSRWGNVIRDSPSLWNQIHCSDSSKVVELALQRSSNNPLDIVLHPRRAELNRGSMSPLMTALDPHRDRWGSMDISVPSQGMGDIITALGEPAPNLERLSFTTDYDPWGTEEFDLFRGSAPRLTDITLSAVSIPWDSEVIHDLTVLDLRWIRFLSTNTILDVLSHSPRLRTVSIYQCSTNSMANPSSPPIQLPHLTSLRLDPGGLEATEDLLGHIEAPERCSLATFFHSCEKIEGFLQQGLLKWMSKWKHSALVPFEGLLLAIDGNDLRVEHSITDRSEPLVLAIEASSWGNSWVDQLRVALPQLIDALASWTKDVTTLHLRLGYPPSGCHTLSFKQFIIEQVSRLPPVTSLEVSGVELGNLFNGLRLGDVSSLFRNVRMLSFLKIGVQELWSSLSWLCEMVEIVRDATKKSPLEELNQSGQGLKLKLCVLNGVPSNEDLLDGAVKRLEGVLGSGNVLVIEDD